MATTSNDFLYLDTTEVYNNETMESQHMISNNDVTLTTTHLHKMAILVITSILLFISLSMSVAVFVFCRKKNAIFTLQKSEQNIDVDYEMDDMPTEIEGSDTDTEYGTSNDQMRSQSYPNMSRLCEYTKNSMIHIPFLPNQSKLTVSCQNLPKSKTFAEKRVSNGKMNVSNKSICCISGRDHNSSKSLPKNLSKSCLIYNYKSMTFTDDVQDFTESGSYECLTYEPDSLKCLNYKSASSESLFSSSANDETNDFSNPPIPEGQQTYDCLTNFSYSDFNSPNFCDRQKASIGTSENCTRQSIFHDGINSQTNLRQTNELVSKCCNSISKDGTSPSSNEHRYVAGQCDTPIDCEHKLHLNSTVDMNLSQKPLHATAHLQQQNTPRSNLEEIENVREILDNTNSSPESQEKNKEVSWKQDNLCFFDGDFNGIFNV